MSSRAIHEAANSSGEVVTTKMASWCTGCWDPFSEVRLWNSSGVSSNAVPKEADDRFAEQRRPSGLVEREDVHDACTLDIRAGLEWLIVLLGRGVHEQTLRLPG